MLVLMAIGLYTSRVVLAQLGIEDYGIYNVVGGLVVLVSYINQAMTNSTIRFLTFSIGNQENKHDDNTEVRLVFSTSLLIHIFLGILFLLFVETVGLWFFYKLVIPPDRIEAAFWVFQFSIISTFLSIVLIPYSSLLIAHERMSVFAWFTIVDALSKLAVAWSMILLVSQRLLWYGALMLLIQIPYFLFYIFYCLRRYPESKPTRVKDLGLARKLLSFSGWSMVGCTASVCNSQGMNILLNFFGGPALNAARGIAVQVQGAINNFATNFQMAVNPQLIKYYAKEELDNMHRLICKSAKFSYYLLIILSLPLMLNIDIVLSWWLKEVPQYTPIFVILIMAVTMVDSLSAPLMKSADASGKIRNYHLIVGGCMLCALPLSWVALHYGQPPYIVFVILFGISVIALFLRLLIVRRLVNLSLRYYAANTLRPVAITTFAAMPLSLAALMIPYPSTFMHFLVVSFIALTSSLTAIWFLGMETSERSFFLSKITKFLPLKNT